VATAPDGSLWYVAKVSHGAVIGHVTSSRTITEFPVSTGDKVKDVITSFIAVGSDGSVWFTGNDYDGLAYTYFLRRMTPNGTFATTQAPAGVGVGKMIPGPDGALWFSGDRDLNPGAPSSQTYEGVTGKLAPDGHITEYPVHASERSLGDLCVGPDKAIWYTVTDPVGADPTRLTGHIVRMSLSGQTQEFAVPYIPNSIASGADGALWYSELVPNPDGQLPSATRKGYIGRITPGDEMKTFTTGENSGIVQIVAAPNTLWLLDEKNTLWRYRLPG
jgi:virginiamycin B lyase